MDLVASSREPSVFRASQVTSLCNEHAHCCAIFLVKIAWCLLSMISVHVQFKCEAFFRVARVHVSRQPLDADISIACSLPPLGCPGTAAVTVHVVSTRKCVWTRKLPPPASDHNRHEHLGPHREVEHFLRDRHLVNGCQRHVGLLPSRSWVSQSRRQKLPLRTEGSAVTVAFRETTIFVSSVFTHMA